MVATTNENLRVEVTPVRAEPDEAEIAAAVACVFHILKSRGVGLKEIQPDGAAIRESNWGIASKLEGVGEAELTEPPLRKSSSRSRWWAARGTLLALLTASSLGFFNSAKAADQDSASGHALDIAAALPAAPFGRSPDLTAQAMPSYPVSQLVPSRSGQVIRILLSRASKTPDLAMIDGASIINLATLEPAFQVAAGSRFQLKCENKRLVFSGADQFALAQASNPSAIRQVVAMAPRVSPPLSGLQSNVATLNKFSLAFEPPDPPAIQPQAVKPQGGQAQASQPPAPKGGVKPVGYLIVSRTKDGLLSYNGRVYRGAIWLKPIRTATEVSFQAINLVDLEDYLISVVPSEMPTSWHLEAVKAQSIAARSYAVANYWKNEKDNYDLKDTTDDQVYLGVESETATGNRACDETSGIVLKHNQKVISAFFHSTSGGATEVGENVWGKEIPYVQSVADYDDNSPHFSWQRKFAVNQAEKALGLAPSSLLSIQPFCKVPSNRVKQAAVVSLDNTTIVTGERLRQLFKLPSSIFNVSFEDGSYIFAGRGFGHGLGMSQYGARTLAESGYNAAQILSYYYRDVSVEYLNRSPGI